ncbi:transposase [Undibacterium terreum]|uniref:transposase n=1 Tax=Undibacterium terreum TaxID=1224302 RepID=UPI0035311A69
MGTTLDTEVESRNRRERPNYSPEFKHRLAVAACSPRVSVSKLAQDHRINTSTLLKWHRNLRAGLLTGPTTEDTRLLPIVLKSSSPAVKPTSGPCARVLSRSPLPTPLCVSAPARTRCSCGGRFKACAHDWPSYWHPDLACRRYHR